MKRNQLIEARYQKHWNQAEAAEALGVSAITISRWENGHGTPHPGMLQRLCELYNREANTLGLGLPEASAEEDSTMTNHLSQSIKKDTHIQLLKIIWSWTGKDIGDLQQEINREIAYTETTISRRQALRSIMLLPIGLAGSKSIATQEVLGQIAGGLTAAWHERRRSDLQLASDSIEMYISMLKRIIAQAPSQHQASAAELIMQCYILKGTIIRHIQGEAPAIQQIKMALPYSSATRSNEQHILALRTIAATHDYADQTEQALAYAEMAETKLSRSRSGGSHQLQSFLYSGLANYQASNGQRKAALKSIDQANNAFFARPETEIPPAWIDHNHMNLIVCAGEAYLHLGDYQAAAQEFDKIAALPEQETTTEGSINADLDRLNVEISRDDQPRDKELCIALWTRAFDAAKAVKSTLLIREAKATYQLMRAAWPTEQSIKNLRDQHALSHALVPPETAPV